MGTRYASLIGVFSTGSCLHLCDSDIGITHLSRDEGKRVSLPVGKNPIRNSESGVAPGGGAANTIAGVITMSVLSRIGASSLRYTRALRAPVPLSSPSLRTLSTTPPTIANAGTLGAASADTDLAVTRGPGALPVAYIDDYHNHKHRFKPGDPTKRAFTYMVLGTTKFIAASAARVLILKLIYTMSASADVLAAGSVEVNLSDIPLGESATIKWRGKPVFIRHRSDEEIKAAVKDDSAPLRDPETDAARAEKPEWLIVLGVCTHLGCVPIANAGDYHGWFCPCHGSHYDMSGRIRKGPAPLNLEVPTYRFIEDDTKLILG